ncbi:MAG TPA: type II toxin-antitoxin system VapC family toxin [Solirubrobacteraceae bacterium]
MSYLLDTSAVIALLRRHPRLEARLRQERPADVAISSIVAHELCYGACRAKRQRENLAIVDALAFPVLDFDAVDARRAGEVRAALAAEGTPIGPYDVLIAGQALSRGVVLVTHNTGEFERVAGLRLEDWEA